VPSLPRLPERTRGAGTEPAPARVDFQATSSVRDLRWPFPMELQAVEDRESAWKTPGQLGRHVRIAARDLDTFIRAGRVEAGKTPLPTRRGA
jgi:hypothetical protein